MKLAAAIIDAHAHTVPFILRMRIFTLLPQVAVAYSELKTITLRKIWIAGYWLWEVKSLEEAIEWAKRCPNRTGEESVLEIRRSLRRKTLEKSSRQNSGSRKSVSVPRLKHC
jgi:hypothetical protein